MNRFAAFLKSLTAIFTAKPTPMSDPSELTILRGDGTWPFSAHVDGDDIIVIGVTATCFGGANDPMDSGETASGVSTKDNPTLKGCALPMAYAGKNKALQKALGGSPIPKLPWGTKVQVMAGGKFLIVPVIDLGPGKRTGNAIDLTIAAARYFKGHASATNFKVECSYRIIGGARHLKGKGTHA